jgi:cysteamine dioxygenase
MSQLTADDLNLNPEMIRRSWDFPPYVKDAPAAFMDVYECKQFSITIFMLKANKSMPLHNHPDMFGLMKILKGSLLINSYNKLDTTHRRKPPYPTHLTTTVVATPSSDPCYLQPDIDNIHELQAQSDHVAFLDILAPPYDPNEGRDCTYYTKVPPPAEDQSVDKYVWLLPGKNPSWFSCVPQVSYNLIN